MKHEEHSGRPERPLSSEHELDRDKRKSPELGDIAICCIALWIASGSPALALCKPQFHCRYC